MLGSQFVTDILKRLIQIPSINPPGKEAKIAEVVCRMLADIGIESALIIHIVCRFENSFEKENISQLQKVKEL